MGTDDYTATVHDIEALERFLARERDRIKSYSVETFGDLYPGDITETLAAFLGDDADEPPEGSWGAWRYYNEYERPGRWSKSHYFPVIPGTDREADAALCGAEPDRTRLYEEEGQYDAGLYDKDRCKLCLRELGE